MHATLEPERRYSKQHGIEKTTAHSQPPATSSDRVNPLHDAIPVPTEAFTTHSYGYDNPEPLPLFSDKT
jgi:hypothetical protein